MPIVSLVFLRAAAALLITSLAIALQPSEASGARQPLIVGGTAVPAGQWSWTVYVQSPAGACAGSLIGAYWAVTAAHCVTGGGTVTVRSGNVDLTAAVPIAASFIATNTAYDPAAHTSDIAIVRLASPATATGILMLPPEQASLADPFRPAWIAGWGQLGDGSLPQVLQQAGLVIAPNNLCGASLLQVCAGGGGHGICYGDSGGPLAVTDALNVPYLAGITSAGPEACGSGPSVFARVSFYAPGLLRYLSNDPVAPVAAPKVNAVSVSSPDATAKITVNASPGNLTSLLRIDYGSGSSLGQTQIGTIGGGAPGSWVTTLAGLQPGITYYYRVSVINSAGTSISQTASFIAGASPGTVAAPVVTPPPTEETDLRAVAFRRSPGLYAVRGFGPGRPGGTFAVAARFLTPDDEAVRDGLVGCGARASGRQLPRYRDPNSGRVWKLFNGPWAICAWRVPQWAAGKVVKGYIYVEQQNGPGVGVYDYSFRLKKKQNSAELRR